MPSAKGKVTVGADVPTELRDDLDARAKAEGRSRAEVIGRALRFYLKWAPVVPAVDEPPDPLTPGADTAPEPDKAASRRGKR